MADIYFKCRCGKSLAVDELAVGRMVDCPECGYRFMIPGPAVQWACPECNAALQAPEEMRGEMIECLACQSELRVPVGPDQQDIITAVSASKPPPRGSGNLSSHLNKLFKDCPQCHERVPSKTMECPHCGHVFSALALKPVIMGGLCVIILAGIVIGLWQAQVWPFAPRQPPAPVALPSPAPVAQASNGVAAVPAQGSTAISDVAQAESNMPAGSPGPTNAFSQEEWMARFEVSRQLVAGQVDRAYPRYATNQDAALRQLDGLVVHGTNAGVGMDKITLIVDDKPVAIAFGDLDAHDRLRVDEEFRSTWIDARAAALSRQSLEQEGIKAPELSTNSEADVDQALALGVPQAQYQVAQQFYKQKDYTYACLYFLAAAEQNHVAAQYALGMICYKGIGVGVDRKEGLTWLALAAAQGHAKAEQFIQQHQITPETRQKLLQLDQLRKEKENQQQAAALKAYQSQQPASAAQPASLLKSPMAINTRISFSDGISGRKYHLQNGKRVYE